MRCITLALAGLGLVLAIASAVEDYDEFYDIEANSTASASTISPSSTVTPPSSTIVGPTAPTPPAPDKSLMLTLNDTDGDVCFRMNAEISVLINSSWNNVNRTVLKNTTINGYIVNTSMCDSKNLSAMIYIEDHGIPDFTLGMYFNGSNKSGSWNLAEVYFDALNVSGNGNVEFVVNSSHLDPYSQNVGFQRYFKCNYSTNLDFNNSNWTMNPDHLMPSVHFHNLAVQVFQFRNSTTGDFINGVTCKAESNQGNKIVPIAVGAALAGLVVIVLIAYLIGRFKSRRQSYEALS